MTEGTVAEAAQSALDEFDNVRWDDVWANLQIAGAEELAGWTRKYVGYVRRDIEETLRLVAIPPAAEDVGTETDCPLEGVHEHAFRGPHRFREWEPGT